MHSLHKGFYELPLSTSPQKVTLVFFSPIFQESCHIGLYSNLESFFALLLHWCDTLILKRVQLTTSLLVV